MKLTQSGDERWRQQNRSNCESGRVVCISLAQQDPIWPGADVVEAAYLRTDPQFGLIGFEFHIMILSEFEVQSSTELNLT
jgi:hypothetical protein